MAKSDQSEEVVRTVVDLLSWINSMSDELVRQRPVGGDLQSVRQQQDMVEVPSLSVCLSICLSVCRLPKRWS